MDYSDGRLREEEGTETDDQLPRESSFFSETESICPIVFSYSESSSQLEQLLSKRDAAFAYLLTCGEKAKQILTATECKLQNNVILEEWDIECTEKSEMLRQEKIRGFRKGLINTRGIAVLKHSRTREIRTVTLKFRSKEIGNYISWKSKWPLTKKTFTLNDLLSISRIDLDGAPKEGSPSPWIGSPRAPLADRVCLRLINSSRQVDFLFDSDADVEACLAYFQTYMQTGS